MNKKLCSITVRGKHCVWSFHTYADPQYLKEWQADGVEIDEVINVIPEWIVDLGLMRPWIFLQDCFHFRNPFSA